MTSLFSTLGPVYQRLAQSLPGRFAATFLFAGLCWIALWIALRRRLIEKNPATRAAGHPGSRRHHAVAMSTAALARFAVAHSSARP